MAWERRIRAVLGMNATLRATMTFSSDGLSAAMSAMARMSKGESHEGVHEPLHNEVGRTSEMHACDSHEEPDGTADQRAHQADVQGDPGSKDDPAVHVAAHLVPSEPHVGAWRGEDLLRVGLVGVIGGDKRGKNGDDYEHDSHRATAGAQRLTPGKISDVLPGVPQATIGPAR